MKDVILIIVLVAIVVIAALYVYRAKKSGKKCIGCPGGCSCSSKESGESCGCRDFKSK